MKLSISHLPMHHNTWHWLTVISLGEERFRLDSNSIPELIANLFVFCFFSNTEAEKKYCIYKWKLAIVMAAIRRLGTGIFFNGHRAQLHKRTTRCIVIRPTTCCWHTQTMSRSKPVPNGSVAPSCPSKRWWCPKRFPQRSYFTWALAYLYASVTLNSSFSFLYFPLLWVFTVVLIHSLPSLQHRTFFWTHVTGLIVLTSHILWNSIN